MLETILTGTTCGEMCWSAREDVCRCSCGGVNHGCLRGEGGERPRRSSRIRGEMYVLAATGTYGDMEGAKRLLLDVCQARRIGATGIATRMNADRPGYYSLGLPEDSGYPVIRKSANDSQVQKWPELAAARDVPRYSRPDSILWVLETIAVELGI